MWRCYGRTIAIRHELRREYYEAAGEPVWLYTPELFMQKANKHLGKTVDETVLQEILETSETVRLREHIEDVVLEIGAERSPDKMAPAQPITAQTVTPTARWRVSPLLDLNSLAQISAAMSALGSPEKMRKALGPDALENISAAVSALGSPEAMRKALGLDALEKVSAAMSALGSPEAMQKAVDLEASSTGETAESASKVSTPDKDGGHGPNPSSDDRTGGGPQDES